MKKKLIIGFFLTQVICVLSSTNQKFDFDPKESQINIGLLSNKSGISFIEYSLNLFQFKKNTFFASIGSSIIYNNFSIGIEKELVDWNQKKSMQVVEFKQLTGLVDSIVMLHLAFQYGHKSL